MSFRTYTLILTYFMAAICAAALSLVESIEPSFTAAVASAAALSLYFNITGRRLIPKLLWNFIALLILASFIADYVFISQSLIVSAARFLAVLFVFKLFDLKTNRDYLLAYALVFFELLAAAASTVSIVFFAALSLFVVGGIWAMIIFAVKKDWQAANPAAGEPPGAIFGIPFFFFVLASSFAAVVAAFMMFYIMPRMELGFFERKTANALKVTGFSERVDLGEIGLVKTDSTIVMRVEVKGGMRGEFMRMRGAALDTYDGKGWRRTIRRAKKLPKDAFGRFTAAGKEPRKMIEQSILLEPLETEVIFAASYPAVIEGKFPVLLTDQSGVLFLPAPPYSRLEYKAWSSTGARLEDAPADMSPFLDVSAPDKDPSWDAVKRLALEVTRGAAGAGAKASAIERYLKANYGYTLNQETGKGGTPLEDFLFYTKAGYCEHFATAMAVMLRAAGVPSRLVTGFTEGDWNRLGGYFIIRQENAHSWVEAYVKDAEGKAGWETYDPTPPSGLGSYTRPSALSLYLDLVKWKWNRKVVHFSIGDQRRFAVYVEGNLYHLAETLKNAFKTVPVAGKSGLTWPIAASVLAAAALVFAAFRLFWSKGKALKTPSFYLEMERMLGRKGIVRRRNETPLEFSKRVGNSFVADLTSAFHQVRYGGGSPPAPDEIKKTLEGLKRSLKDARQGV